MLKLILLILLSSSIQSEPFLVGEKFDYSITWGIITVGHATMSIPDKVNFNGCDCLILETTATGTTFINKIFPVKDSIISYWELKTKRTFRSEKNLNEGNYHRHTATTFDYAARKAYWKEIQFSGNTETGKLKPNTKWKNKEGIIEKLPEEFQDILSAIYYNRSHPKKAEVGTSFVIDLFDDVKITKLKMVIHKKEKLNIKLNEKEVEFDSIITQPFYETTGIFKASGDIKIWISDDERRIPLKIVAKVPYVGNVVTILEGMN